jgi:DnaJ-domain-containing protein 1
MSSESWQASFERFLSQEFELNWFDKTKIEAAVESKSPQLSASLATIVRALKSMVANGLLEEITGSGRTPNTYRFIAVNHSPDSAITPSLLERIKAREQELQAKLEAVKNELESVAADKKAAQKILDIRGKYK